MILIGKEAYHQGYEDGFSEGLEEGAKEERKKIIEIMQKASDEYETLFCLTAYLIDATIKEIKNE